MRSLQRMSFFLVIHVYAALRAPNYSINERSVYPLKSQNETANFDISFPNIQPWESKSLQNNHDL
jgi:hypothetical protein